MSSPPGRFSMSTSRYRHFDGLRAVAAAALLAAALLTGCGEGGGSAASTRAGATAAAAGSTSTNTVSRSSTGASKAASTARPGPSSAKASKAAGANQTAANPTARTPPPGGSVLRRFAGSGNTRLGTIAVGSTEVLVWKAQHPSIQIFTARGFMLVSSGAPSGSVQLRRGAYQGVRVATHAGWTIELRARS